MITTGATRPPERDAEAKYHLQTTWAGGLAPHATGHSGH